MHSRSTRDERTILGSTTPLGVAVTPKLPNKYLLFLGDVNDPGYAKTAFGLRDWAPNRCVGEFGVNGLSVSTGLPRLTAAEAYARGAEAAVIGVATVGGRIAASWLPALAGAMEAGLDLVSGMHTPLASVPELVSTAARCGRQLIDVRRPPAQIQVATGRKRSGKRLLAVGTDCALGKKYTALAIAQAFREHGADATFRATGQTGILIAGSGIPIDAVVSDFVAGAAELLTPDASPEHWDIIEGQGSLFHPAYAAVSLGLLHGSQPDVIVVCHTVGRETMLGFPAFPLPTLRDTVDLNLRLARRVNPSVRCGGISLNTAALSADDAQTAVQRMALDLGLAVADPIRGGTAFNALVNACLHQ
ncbi:MAG TPA: DUF1611 domain-containing protein [Steroidobacteraceae bacterium]|jgi:uncharacterized NAD-dependent epimerase/dehydratase family protein